MKERIKKIMDEENMTPTRFADSLNIGRAVISHILNGRNNPSLDIVTRILTQMPHISPEWLLSGTGAMYKNDQKLATEDYKPSTLQAIVPDLFTQPIAPAENSIKVDNSTIEKEYRTDTIVNKIENKPFNHVNEHVIYKEKPDKKIKQIIVYYTDNTFESFKHE
ncbi:MAG: hypothetical protein RL662_1507 [Bacteroidota bacterium]|jgi:transcriptional regulator with XRE-family HTH domain